MRRAGSGAVPARSVVSGSCRQRDAAEALTMQAVAEALGVDPKALNYHVGDREGLRGLVALDVFETELGRVELPADGDWRVVTRSYAAALRDAFTQLGVLAGSYFSTFPRPADWGRSPRSSAYCRPWSTRASTSTRPVVH